MHGMICGGLTAAKGSTVALHGTVNGTVLNKWASAQIIGIVDRVVDDDLDSLTLVHDLADLVLRALSNHPGYSRDDTSPVLWRL
jgi:hypothetical protein